MAPWPVVLSEVSDFKLTDVSNNCLQIIWTVLAMDSLIILNMFFMDTLLILIGKTAKYVTVSYSCTKLIQLKYTLLVGMHKFL